MISLLLIAMVFSVYAVRASHQVESVVTDPVDMAMAFATSDSFDTEVVSVGDEEEFDRDSFVAKMREAVLERESDTESVASFEIISELTEDRLAMADLAEAETNVVLKEPEESAERSVRWCDATVLETRFLASWPKENVSLVTTEGARVVLATVMIPNASSTPGAQEVTLAQFPLVPPLQVEPTCLLHSYVGVALDGRLIHNSDTLLYHGKSADELIGYAFDGNPIYGTDTEDEFDECGGNLTPTGYRYQLRADEDFILGCFVSQSSQMVDRG